MSLESTLKNINKEYGKGSIMRMGDAEIEPVDVIPTGSLALDIALGVGGIPRGRIIEMYGPESSGKTTLALNVMAQAQRMGLKGAMIDAEHAFDPSWAKLLGVNVDDMLLAQPTTAEESLEITDQLIRSNEVGVIVVDSVAALTPKAELEGNMGDAHMGLMARLMSQAMRKLTSNILRTNTTVIFINQIRIKIGVMFGNPETTSGGNALKFYASVRLDIRRRATLKKEGADPYGTTMKVKIVKNKVAPPFKIVEFDLHFDKGLDRMGELVDLGEKYGIIEKKGSWYHYLPEDGSSSRALGQGKASASAKLALDEDSATETIGWYAADVDRRVREKANAKTT